MSISIVVIHSEKRHQASIKDHFLEYGQPIKSRFFDSAEEFQKILLEKTVDIEENFIHFRIDLILIEVEPLMPDIVNNIQGILKKLATIPTYDKTKRPRICLLAYSDLETKKSALNSHIIDDLLYVPLDQSLFLQRVQLLLQLPDRLPPSFLFSHPANGEILISKIVPTVAYSEFGIIVKNMLPLKLGLNCQILVQLPGMVEAEHILFKLDDCIEDKSDGRFWLKLRYMGIRSGTLLNIRKKLALNKKYRPLIVGELDPDMVPKLTRPKNIYVISASDQVTQQVTSCVRSQVHGAQVIVENSYYIFQKKLMEPKEFREEAVITTKQDDDDVFSLDFLEEEDDIIFNDSFLFQVDSELHLEKIITSHNSESTIMGISMGDLKQTSKSWLNIFSKSDMEPLLDEMTRVAWTSGSCGRTQALKLNESKQVSCDITVERMENGRSLQITLSESQKVNTDYDSDGFQPIDMVIIDSSMAPDPQGLWIRALQARAKKQGRLPESGKIEIIVMGFPDESFSATNYAKVELSGLLYKPIDIRSMAFALTHSLPDTFSIYNWDNIQWQECHVEAHFSKVAQLDEISEYGGSIINHSPIAPGTTLYVHGDVFDSAPGKKMCIRFNHTSASRKVEGQFLCSFIYFGVNDIFLKTLRAWLVERYAKSKAG